MIIYTMYILVVSKNDYIYIYFFINIYIYTYIYSVCVCVISLSLFKNMWYGGEHNGEHLPSEDISWAPQGGAGVSPGLLGVRGVAVTLRACSDPTPSVDEFNRRPPYFVVKSIVSGWNILW